MDSCFGEVCTRAEEQLVSAGWRGETVALFAALCVIVGLVMIAGTRR